MTTLVLRHRLIGGLNSALTRGRKFVAVIAVILLAAALSCGSDASPLVFAAASMSDALAEVAESYRQETGRDVRFSFGGSRALAIQIADLGAPADAVIFVGESPFGVLEQAGLIGPGDRTNVLANSLVVASRGQKIPGIAGLAANSAGLIAIADPSLAPSGEYAIAALDRAGVLDDLDGRTVRTIDVRAALAAVSSGNAQFAIAYETDVLAVDGVEIAFEIPPSYHPPIVYPAAVIADSDAGSEAGQFIEYLQTEQAWGIFDKNGFRRPG